MNKLLLTALFAAFFNCTVLSQSKYNESEFKTKPVWTKMINDPDVNYYQAVKAFKSFWEGKIKPEGEDDFINEKEKGGKEAEREQKELEEALNKMTVSEREEFNSLKYHYKRFETWMREVKPFVQEDGRILSEQERMNLWKKQQSEIKLQK